ncbi:unnamed protein product [Lasius platythorax]|uniref:Uncharacterized protein n=1 Tax=Lasius platythorax TaxID=488582 RepID=A0AAV2NTN0_9HYME
MPARVTTMACNITRAFSSEAEGGEEKRSGTRREGETLAEDAGLDPGSGRNGISNTKSCYYGCLPSVGSSWRYL